MTERVTGEEGFAVMRRSERNGEECLDFVSIRATEDAALSASELANGPTQIQWRKDNPVVATVLVKLQVVKRWARRSNR